MQFLKCTKISLWSINFAFLFCVVILITDMNGSPSEEGKKFEDNYMLYLYFTSITGFVGIQSRSHFISLIFTGLQVYGLHASYQLLNFYWFSKFDPSELEEMRVNIENYVRTNGSLGHMHRFQERGQCCGLDSKDIYNASSLGIPYSCCINGKPGQECPYERAFNRPCISRYHKRFIFYRYINLTLFSSIGIIQICAIFFSLIFICLVPKKRPEPVCEPTSV